MDTTTGRVYKAKDAVKARAAGLIPLKCEPKASCKKCYGRGHLGRNVLTDRYEVCPCCRAR